MSSKLSSECRFVISQYFVEHNNIRRWILLLKCHSISLRIPRLYITFDLSNKNVNISLFYIIRFSFLVDLFYAILLLSSIKLDIFKLRGLHRKKVFNLEGQPDIRSTLVPFNEYLLFVFNSNRNNVHIETLSFYKIISFLWRRLQMWIVNFSYDVKTTSNAIYAC